AAVIMRRLKVVLHAVTPPRKPWISRHQTPYGTTARQPGIECGPSRERNAPCLNRKHRAGTVGKHLAEVGNRGNWDPRKLATARGTLRCGNRARSDAGTGHGTPCAPTPDDGVNPCRGWESGASAISNPRLS